MILHIFKKDIRRLWPAVALSLVLLAALSHEDRLRMDRLPGLNEGWLNILAPLAWTLLIALVIHEERLGDDREFWVTRPYRRGALLAAKALFLVASIQLPALLADAYIVAGRGFSPVVYFPQLLAKQLQIAALLVAPAAAIAALTRTLATFSLAAIGAPAAVLLLNSSLGRREPEPNVRLALTVAVIAGVAVIVLLMSYFGRRRLLARALAAAGGIAAAAFFLFAPPAFTARLRSRLVNRPVAPSMRLDPRPPAAVPPPVRNAFANSVTVALPVAVDGLAAGRSFRILGLEADMVAPGGERYTASTNPLRPLERPLLTLSIWFADPSRPYFLLSIDPVLYSRLATSRVRVTGVAGGWIYRLASTTSLPIGTNRPVPGLGRCTAVETLDDQGGGLKVVCESPAGFLGYAPVRLISGRDGRQWQEALGDWGPRVTVPLQPWLSPVERRQAFFRITDRPEVFERPGGRWLVPRSALDLAEVNVTPYAEFGSTVVNFDFRDVALATYLRP